MNFEELVKSRHSALNFVEDFEMTESDFKNIFDLTKLAPSTYNLQCTNYLVVTDKAKRDKIYELSYNQHKLKTASAIVLVLGDSDSLTVASAEKVYSPMKMLKMITEEEHDNILNQITSYAQGVKHDSNYLKLELQKVCCINAAFFMMSAKYYGFDTCPMHTHNEGQLREEFNIPTDKEIVMMIPIGKSIDKTRHRGYRKPINEFVKFNSFT